MQLLHAVQCPLFESTNVRTEKSGQAQQRKDKIKALLFARTETLQRFNHRSHCLVTRILDYFVSESEYATKNFVHTVLRLDEVDVEILSETTMPSIAGLLSSQMSQTLRWYLRRESSRIINRRAQRRDPAAASFYNAMRENGYDADTYIDVLPKQRLIYLNVPKSASTTVRSILSTLEWSKPPPLNVIYKRRCSGLIPKLRNHDSCRPELCLDGRIVNVSHIKHLYGRYKPTATLQTGRG